MSLIGAWIVDRSDLRAVAELGDVLLEFGEGGGLLYTTRGPDKDQIMKLRYSVEGATIVTDQPSAPRVERTAYALSDDDRTLTLAFGGVPYRFVRATANS